MNDKIAWMLTELNKDGFYPTEGAVNRVINGEEITFFEPALVDYIMELQEEWDQD